MPLRSMHNKDCVALGLVWSIANEVNRLKDAPSQKHPRDHRGWNHGILLSFKYRLIDPQGSWVSRVHNLRDRQDGFQKRGLEGIFFIRERIITWYPGKVFNNFLNPYYGSEIKPSH